MRAYCRFSLAINIRMGRFWRSSGAVLHSGPHLKARLSEMFIDCECSFNFELLHDGK